MTLSLRPRPVDRVTCGGIDGDVDAAYEVVTEHNGVVGLVSRKGRRWRAWDRRTATLRDVASCRDGVFWLRLRRAELRAALR